MASFFGTLPVNKLCSSVILFPSKKKRAHNTVRPLRNHSKMSITKGHKQNIVCGLNSQLSIVNLKKGYKNQRQYYICLGLSDLEINFPKRLRTMFRGINLFGAEINANFSEQHHAHLFLSNTLLSISICALFVKLEWVSFPIVRLQRMASLATQSS